MADKSSILLDSLNAEQRAVVLCTEGPVLVIAGPGSGKTRALTHKIAYLIKDKNVRSDEILAVTFTNKAAIAMKERVTSLLKTQDNPIQDNPAPSWMGTFHSLCARILRTNAKYLDVTNSFVIYDTDDSRILLKQVIEDFGMTVRDVSPRSVLSTISRAKGEMVGASGFRAFGGQSLFYQKVADIYPVYQKTLRKNNALDFGDLLFETALLLEREQSVLHKYRQGFRYVLVDEYQDTNLVQYHLIELLVADHLNVTVVGDVSQSIYSWRGADYRNMKQFEKDYPQTKTFHLAKNYRSTQNILQAAKNVIEHNKTHIAINLSTDNVPGDQLRLFEAEHERGEAGYVTDMISFFATSQSTPEGYPEKNYKDFAVLYRTNAQSRALEEAFLNAGIPYRIIGGIRFYDRKEIKDAIAYLRVFFNPKDEVSWGRCINMPPRGVGKKTLERIKSSKFDPLLVDEITKVPFKKYVKKAKDGVKPLELLDGVLKDFGYLEYLDDGTEESLARIENLRELRTVAGQYDSLGMFLENIALIESSNKIGKQDENSVVLMTLHSAKGLEFDCVFMIGMEEGLFPHSRSMADPDELEEERRLCYVGMTRAKKNLIMTYTRRRTYFGNTGAALISRFIAEIPEELIEFKAG